MFEQDNSHQEVPDEEEEREDDLTDPVGLTDAHTHLSQLTRVEIVSVVGVIAKMRRNLECWA